MKSDRAAAYKLRVTGHSYNEVSAKLGTPKSTLNGWFKDLVLSDAARTRLLGRVRQGTLNSFVKQIISVDYEILKIIGATLYWAEGYKRLKIRGGKERMGHPISFVNADEVMIRTFLKFLKKILQVQDSKIHLYMRLYEHINEETARQYWMKVTGFPKESFHKTTYLVSIASKRKRPYNRLPYGTLQIEVCDTQKFHYLMGLIEGVKKQF